MLMAVCALASSGCLEDYDLPDNTGSLGGYVMISGPVRGARVTIDRLNAHTGVVYKHVGDDTTDERGHFFIPETREASGLFLMVARGGTFEDLATGATIQLDGTDELRSFLQFPILADRDDGLVSPIGHLIEAWAWATLPELGDMTAAVDDATAHLAKHFGQATQWGLLKLHDLGTPATSPTEPVRTAFVHAALSYLAHDIASASGVSAQQVNVYTLLQRWTADLVRDGTVDPAGFDGNDGNDATPGSGLQLGYCEPLAPCVDPPAGCGIGSCRPLCDLYAGTPRALLAGAITKVIRDDSVNRTGLRIEDTLSIAHEVADNADRSLFGDSCIEPLDRTRPDVRWDESATPAADAAVAGVIWLKAIGTDDVDLQPRTEILGYADQDGDSSNNVAIASIDTATVTDGDLIVSARAVDLAGNTSTITRRLIVDNTSPQLTMSSAGFFVDGSTWWTASAAPVLTGTTSDATSVAVKAVIEGGSEVAGVVAGATWTIAIPPGVLDVSGTAVQIVAIDAAGNRSSLALRLRPDLEPPVLSFQTSTVNDEEGDWVTFAADHSPRHLHAGIPVDLATAAGCPSLTKHSYLLGSTSPEYTAELPGPNPLRYQLVTDDPGVGVAAGSTEYRVGLRAGLQTNWVQDWTPAGTGIPIGTGVTRFPIGIFSDVVAGLATTEGIYDVEFRATDRLERTTTAARCFDLHLAAPPLELEYTTTSRPTKDHSYALDSLSLAPDAQYDQIAARLLNDNATGASLIDQDIFNGTTATIYLTVTVTKPYSVMVSQTFVLGNANTNVTPANCGSSCNTPLHGDEYTSAPSAPQATTLHFPAKVFELVNGQPITEIPCLAPCPSSGTVFKFAIPPRAGGGQPARAFRVMTMIGQISELWPRDGVQHKEVQPFEDAAITWADDNGYETTTRLTGKVYYSNDPAYTGCVKFVGDVCVSVGTVVPYLALRSAELTFTTRTITRYETAATATLAPALARPDKSREAVPANNWTTSESVLP
jgi:hypothetical protein